MKSYTTFLFTIAGSAGEGVVAKHAGYAHLRCDDGATISHEDISHTVPGLDWDMLHRV